MKVSELMTGFTPKTDYKGVARADDFVLAIDFSDSGAADPNEYLVAQDGVTEHSGTLNPKTSDKTYMRSGTNTSKVGNQRQFKLSGDVFFGDEFLDKILAFGVKYGTGNQVIKPYVYFNVLTGIGEKGLIAIMVEDDPTGAAGDDAGFSATLAARGTPEKYTYTKNPK